MPKNGLLRRVAGHSIAHPWRVLGAALVVVALMGIAGKDAKSVLGAPSVDISGSPSARAMALERAKFGRAETVAVMLSGPRREVDRYGPKAVRALGRIDSVEATSPWGRQAPPGLIRDSGKDRSALIILRVDRDLQAAGKEITPRVRATLDEVVPDSVSTKVTGMAPLATAFIEATLTGTEKAEIFAAPFLLLILLLIFRSPLAAALPLVGGVSVIVVATGVGTLASRLFQLDLYVTVGVSIVGLALGVDYSLLVVSRFREELARAPTAAVAARAATMTAGRTVVVAGTIVAIGMAIAMVIVPGTSLVSCTFGVSLAALLSVLTAVTILPAVLTVLGPRIDLWRIGRHAPGTRLAPLVGRLTRKPGITTAVVLVPLLAVAALAFGIKTGPPEWRFLPKDNHALRDFQTIERTFGGGWGAPFEVLVRSKRGPVTKPETLSAIASFQDLLAEDPDVQEVIGPKPINTQVRKQLRATPKKARSRLDAAFGVKRGFEKAANSGYLTLAAIEGTSRDAQQRANLVVNADLGGDTARLVVIPKGHPVDVKPFAGRLHAMTDDLGFQTGAQATVAGPATQLYDYERLATERRILAIAVLSLITFPFLTAVFRSLLLAAKAVILNLLVVGATFGIMTWLVEGSNPVLGGPGFMDSMAFLMIYGVVFTLSMDYEIFIINRMREGYAATGSTDKAVEMGIKTTAGVVTGAAAIMVVVFLAFATFGTVNVRMMGVAMAIAVILDATIVRLILLPATMRLFGKWNWWLPRWLERRLPNLDREGRRADA